MGPYPHDLVFMSKLRNIYVGVLSLISYRSLEVVLGHFQIAASLMEESLAFKPSAATAITWNPFKSMSEPKGCQLSCQRTVPSPFPKESIYVSFIGIPPTLLCHLR